jgi:hypothetical protein
VNKRYEDHKFHVFFLKYFCRDAQMVCYLMSLYEYLRLVQGVTGFEQVQGGWFLLTR